MVDEMSYTVRARRWEGGWELHIEDVGVTQCRTLDNAERQAQDYIETLRGIVDATVVVTPELGDVLALVSEARAATVAAARAQEDAAARSRVVARTLRDRGLSVSDTAHVLGVSRGRVSQLVK